MISMKLILELGILTGAFSKCYVVHSLLVILPVRLVEGGSQPRCRRTHTFHQEGDPEEINLSMLMSNPVDHNLLQQLILTLFVST